MKHCNQTNNTKHNDETYMRIAMAITRQAAADYQREYREYLDFGIRSKQLEDLEEWFRSPRGQLFSFGMGETIIKMIQDGEQVLTTYEGLIYGTKDI